MPLVTDNQEPSEKLLLEFVHVILSGHVARVAHCMLG